MNTDLHSILKLVLPEFLVDNFDIVKIEKISSTIETYLEENKNIPLNFDENIFI